MGALFLNTLEKNVLMFVQRQQGHVAIKHVTAYLNESNEITLGVLKMMQKKKLLTIDYDTNSVQMDFGIYAKLKQ